ncbi:GDSL-type esterase/lipase family protein [Flavobacterium tibetense]|uniref:Peptidoglycan-binding protein n=1 Tax=Flavobacterium tibetense TaxID=2233533 RepID=A0A365P3Q6_9FLAO|nr:GDSL-type esterase/lipase family protein [Flavobacterium tibetense]RBA29202.1 peptidoglycan-binding protein [Flavobacterium tibetense]
MKNKIFLFFFFITQLLFAQVDSLAVDSLEVNFNEVIIDSVVVDSIEVTTFQNQISNAEAIKKFYQKLQQLEVQKNCKLRIVHIGDSHIQADLFTGKTRSLLQQKYGNGGLGFTFPYNLAKTNGSHYIKYNATASFESYRNIYSDSTKPVGLSGIALFTTTKDVAIELQVRDKNFVFNSLKLVMPKNQRLFDVAITSKEIIMESSVPKTITHKIKSGEALSIIASKYGVSVSAIKKVNGLKSNNIQAGKTLRIPSNELEPKKIVRSEFQPLTLFEDVASQNYYSQEPLDKIFLVSNAEASSYALNGLILENNESGIVYSAIGVNGAKASDYNRFPEFYQQLQAIEADLVVISLGTNESFDKQNSTIYFDNLQKMIAGIRAKNPSVEILVVTPPPSLFKRKFPNTFVADYAKVIQEKASENNYAVWDMFQALGGLFNVNRNFSKGYMSKDKVHYSKLGYEKQAELFFEALEYNYEQFKSAQ